MLKRIIAIVSGGFVLATISFGAELQQQAEQKPATNAVSDDANAAYDEMETLTEVMLQVKRYYVKEKTYREITHGALHGMMEALDSHSSFMEPEAYSDMQDDTAGKFSGIGIHIGQKDGVLSVIAPIEDTPAFRAGLQSGDRIIEVDGEKTINIPLKDAVKKLRGPKGTKVTVTIARTNTDGPFKVEIVRDDIEVPSVKGARMLGNGIGYVRITQFAAPTVSSLQTALDSLTTNRIEGFILDLRSNPGGLLTGAIGVAEKFLKPDSLIVCTKGRDGVQPKVESRSRGTHHYTDFPMVVLVDGGSASASEIVAGALQDNKRAVLVGSTTYGKGSVQSVLQLKSDPRAAIRLTTALYYTPSGSQINEKGIEPDIPVALSGEEWRKVQIRRAHIENPAIFNDEEKKPYLDVVDRQLQRAYDLLLALKTVNKK